MKIKKDLGSIFKIVILGAFFFSNFSIILDAHAQYGVNTGFIVRVMPANRTGAARQVKSMGAQYGREEFNMENIRPSSNRYYWANADQAVNSYKAAGLNVIGMIAYSAPWASTNPGAGGDAQFYPPNMDQWRQYVSDLVHRYGYYVKDWEIWNEPNHFWRGDLNQYRDLLINSYDVIKSIDPGARVATGGLTWIDEGWISELMDNGGWEHADAVSVHYYPGVGPESDPNYSLRPALVNLENNVLNPRGGKDIWITETGWQSKIVGLSVQGELVARAITLARSVGSVKKVVIYTLRDEKDGNTFGLLTQAFRQKISYIYAKRAIQYIGSRNIVQLFENMGGSNFYVFDGAGGKTGIAWNPDRTQTNSFSISVPSIKCYNYNGREVTQNVVKSYSNGNATMVFAPAPVFCSLSGQNVSSSTSSKKTLINNNAK